jgi:hypothetical protein
MLIAGTLPGVVAGAIIRVEFLAGGRSFMFIASGVLLPLGLWLLLGSQRIAPARPQPGRRARRLLYVLALAYEVAPATLLATFITSIAGIAAYEALQLVHGGSIAPEWGLGLCIGIGGFAGSYLGARVQSRLPETSLRRLLGLVACLTAIRYAQEAIQHPARLLPVSSQAR